MPDPTLDVQDISEQLDRIGGEASLKVWNHGGTRYYCVLVQTDADDRITRTIGDNAQPAEREDWQRKNLVLALGTDLAKVMWEAGRREQAPLVPYRLTLWFDRVKSQYHLGPCCERYGKSGRPVWADVATSGGLIVPPGILR